MLYWITKVFVGVMLAPKTLQNQPFEIISVYLESGYQKSRSEVIELQYEEYKVQKNKLLE